MTEPPAIAPLTRRAALAGAGGLLAATALPLPAASLAGRPARGDRRFVSPAVEAAIVHLQRLAGPGKLASMIGTCLPNTLDTTIDFTPGPRGPDTFVITGDIHAMWLRDSSAQLAPYLRFAGQDAHLAEMLRGVIARQSRSVLIDPYANAFNKGPTGSEFDSDQTVMKPELHERKWEIDSLCYPIKLAHDYWRATGDTRPFDAEWREAGRLTLQTFRTQQRKEGPNPYSFQRVTGWNPDSVPNGGHGNPVRAVGLIASHFRPSDDACLFPFLVPSNLFAVASLRQLADMHQTIVGDLVIAGDARALAAEVEAALWAHAVVEHPVHGRIWAFEVDGYGSRLLIDDANAPSLLSLIELGAARGDDPVALATRRFALSPDNPWFFRGRAAEGVGSPHTGDGRVWPIAIIMRALTSTDDAEIVAQLRMLLATDAGTGFMHEAFDKDDPAKFSRPWFAWANSLFGKLMLDLAERKPALLRTV